MTARERSFIAILLLVIALVVAWDLINDFRSGSSWLHIFVESMVAVSALAGAMFVWGRFHVLKQENKALKVDVERWKQESSRHVQGLSKAIDDQLSRWGLTPSEKEIALLLLKGLSLKEIAQIRDGSERTARQHSLMVYQKSGLSGRAELSAFFLEDLLTPIDRS